MSLHRLWRSHECVRCAPARCGSDWGGNITTLKFCPGRLCRLANSRCRNASYPVITVCRKEVRFVFY